ncbi:MAG: Rieske (2Fe-2S) protein [Gammaproteobacteria bacterium]
MSQQYQAVAMVGEVPVGTMHCVQVAGKRVLIANVDGVFHAVDEMCSHEDYSLCYGALQGERIKCSLHGSRFDLKTGQPLDDPADEPINVFSVKVEGEQILLALD